MASTVFRDRQTPIMADWLNDVNSAIYSSTIPVWSSTEWTDITSQLQTAANAGGRWKLPEGNYEFTTINITTNFILEGCGDKTRLRRKANLDTTSPSASTAIGLRITSHDINVCIKDIMLDGNEANQILEAYGYLAGFSGIAGSSGSNLRLWCNNVTFIDATQAAIRADGDTSTAGREHLLITNCRFIDGRYGLAAGDPSVISASGYGPDYITLTDKVFATIIGNEFIFDRVLTTGQFSRTAIRITFNTNTDNTDGSRAIITDNYFIGCGRGERGTVYTATGGTGTLGAFSVETLSGTGVATVSITHPGVGYTSLDVLSLTGGASIRVDTVSSVGGITGVTILAAGTGYTKAERPDNDVGVIDAYARGRELIITNNTFNDSQGTPIRGKTNCDLVNISNNIIDTCNRNPGINIGPNSYAQQSGRINIHDNIMRQVSVYGIAVVGNAGAVTSGPPNTQMYIADVSIAGNIVEGVNSWTPQLNPASADAIRVRNFRNLNVVGNMIGGTAQYGINLLGQSGTYDAVHANVSNNRVEAPSFMGVFVQSSVAGQWIVHSNTVINAGGRGFNIESASGAGGSLSYQGNMVDTAVDYGHYFRRWDTAMIIGNHAENITGLSRGFYPQDTVTTKIAFNTTGAGVSTPLVGFATAQSAVHDFGNSWNAKVMYASAVPVANTWNQGDIVYNSAPASAGFIGWVCTTAGTPGTWKTFGLIS